MELKELLADAADWAERNGHSLAEQLAEAYNAVEVDISTDGVAIAREAGGALHWVSEETLRFHLAQLGYAAEVE